MAFRRSCFNRFLHPHKHYIRAIGKTNTHRLLVQRTKKPAQMFTKQPQKTGRKTNIQRCRATNKHRKKISVFLAIAFEHNETIWGNPPLNLPRGRFELSVFIHHLRSKTSSFSVGLPFSKKADGKGKADLHLLTIYPNWFTLHSPISLLLTARA